MITHDEMIDVIAHHKNGGKVECRERGQDEWIYTEPPAWDFFVYEYRKKIEPRSLWEVRWQNGKFDSAWVIKHNAEARAGYIENATIHEYKEVIE